MFNPELAKIYLTSEPFFSFLRNACELLDELVFCRMCLGKCQPTFSYQLYLLWRILLSSIYWILWDGMGLTLDRYICSQGLPLRDFHSVSLGWGLGLTLLADTPKMIFRWTTLRSTGSNDCPHQPKFVTMHSAYWFPFLFGPVCLSCLPLQW